MCPVYMPMMQVVYFTISLSGVVLAYSSSALCKTQRLDKKFANLTKFITLFRDAKKNTVISTSVYLKRYFSSYATRNDKQMLDVVGGRS